MKFESRFKQCIDIVLIFFKFCPSGILDFGEKQNKPVLGGVRIVALSICSLNRLNKTESAVFFYIVGSLLLKDPFFQII